MNCAVQAISEDQPGMDGAARGGHTWTVAFVATATTSVPRGRSAVDGGERAARPPRARACSRDDPRRCARRRRRRPRAGRAAAPARRRRSGGTRSSSGSSSVSAPTRVAATGSPAAIASAHERPNVSARRDGTSASAAPARSRASSRVVHAARERHVAAEPRRERPQLAPPAGPAPATTSGSPSAAHAVIATSTPLSVARRPATSAYEPSAGRRAGARRRPARPGSRTTATSRAPSGAPSARRR